MDWCCSGVADKAVHIVLTVSHDAGPGEGYAYKGGRTWKATVTNSHGGGVVVVIDDDDDDDDG